MSTDFVGLTFMVSRAVLICVSLTMESSACAGTIRPPSAHHQFASAVAVSTPSYDCLLAAGRAASTIIGTKVKDIRSHYDGYAGTTSAGSVYVEMRSCYEGSKASVVEFAWTDKKIPLTFSLPEGPIRYIRMTDYDSQFKMRIVDDRGRSASFTPVKIPTSISCYCQAGPQDVFYNFDQPGRADRSVTVIAIVDTKAGPSLRSEDVP